MSASAASAAGSETARRQARRQIRGSSLLLAGRLLSHGLNFATQVLVVRYLAKADYGALAYALSVVGIGEAAIVFGLDRAVTRFVPIFHEQGDYRKLAGTLALVLGAMASLALATLLGVHGLAALNGAALAVDPTARAVLLVLIFLAPLQAADTVLIGMFAVLASPRAIFLRRHVLGPLLRLAVVGAAIGGGFGLGFLAWGYVAAGFIGVALYSTVLVRLVRREGLLRGLGDGVEVPWRPVLAFTIPLISSDLVYVAVHAAQGVMLERFHDTLAVASLRAVLPVAMLNQIVFASFTTLYTPQAARLYARNDRAAISALYWQTAIWIAVISFPVFALTFALAQPLAVLLFGQEYSDAGLLLAVLAAGYYFNAALGFNGLTLKVFGRVGYVVAINVATLAASIAISFWLIPIYGALGAALATAATLVIHNVLKHVGLLLGTGVSLLESQGLRAYATIALAAATLLVVRRLLEPPFAAEVALAAAASLWVLRVNRHALEAREAFPELLRLPLIGRILAR